MSNSRKEWCKTHSYHHTEEMKKHLSEVSKELWKDPNFGIKCKRDNYVVSDETKEKLRVIGKENNYLADFNSKEKDREWFVNNGRKGGEATVKKGRYISKEQYRLFEILKSIYSNVCLEYPIKTLKSTKFLDVALLDLKVDIEYDGFHHETPERRAKDEERDKELVNLGWKIIRINKYSFREFIINPFIY